MPITPTPRTRTPSRDLIQQNGSAIRALREKDGWDAAGFAAAIDSSYSHLRNIENETRQCSPLLLNRIARQLRVPVSAISRDPVESGQDDTNRAVAV